MGNPLIGGQPARLDRSGRLKIPEKFRAAIEETYGNELFVTSMADESIIIYPLSVWEAMTGITNEGAFHLNPSVRKFQIRVSKRGSYCQIDSKGRVLINQALREKANLNEDVTVLGLSNRLEVWNTNRLDDAIEERPLTDEDFKEIARLMSQEKGE